jgi:hypothetical protein
VKDEKGHLVIDCHNILARWRKRFSQLLNGHAVNDVRQTEIHTAFEVEMAIVKLIRRKSTGIDQIAAEMIK